MPIIRLARAVALFDGRDPDRYTGTDLDEATRFLNMFNAALYEVRQRLPCSRCRGSGLEPHIQPVVPAVVVGEVALAPTALDQTVDRAGVTARELR